MQKLFALIILYLVPIICSAQMESAIWYFGYNAGLDFRSGTAVPIYDGQLQTDEGCASISDFEGNLQFYTDGIYVWNRNHELMPNGSGLSGDPSSTQSAIIIPIPEESRKYYIFTVGADDNIPGQNNYLEGFNYYIVDMSLNNGLGDVLPFNGEGNPMEALPYTSEKLAATMHPSKSSYWLLTHYEDSFYAYHITNEGIQSPVISTIGPVLPSIAYPVNARGYLKVSPDGEKIAIAHLSYLEAPLTPSSNGSVDNAADGIIATYDFDPLTGIVSNETLLNGNSYEDVSGTPYGLEFSSNSQFLYAELDYFMGSPIENTGAKLYQYNLQNPTAEPYQLADTSAFANSGASSLYKARGALQLGLDKKIYYTTPKDTSPASIIALSVINNPNLEGVQCDYQNESMLIRTPEHPNVELSYGLPPFVSSFFSIDIIFNTNINISNECIGSDIQFDFQVNDDVNTVLWDFGDGNTSTEFSPTHTYEAAGEYTVQLDIVTLNGESYTTTRTISIFAPRTIEPVSVQNCDDNADGITSFNLNLATQAIQAQTDDISFIQLFYTEEDALNNVSPIDNLSNFTNTNAETQLFARIDGQCPSFSIVNLVVMENKIDLTEGLVLCDDTIEDGFTAFDLSLMESDILSLFGSDAQIISYHTSSYEASLQIDALSLNYTNTLPYSQQIFARVESNNLCDAIVSFPLTVLPLPNVEDLTIYKCPEFDELILEVDDIFESYEWSNANGEILSLTNTIEVEDAGEYTLTVANASGDILCYDTAIYTVIDYESPVITFIEVDNNSTINVIATYIEGLLYSLDGINWQSSPVFYDVPAGSYLVKVKSESGCISLPYPIGVLDVPNVITPNGDGRNDEWRIPGLVSYPKATVSVYDRYGKMLHTFVNNDLDVIIPTLADYQLPGFQNPIIWDGYYLGRKVPSTSYWYIIQLPDGRKFKGWLTVKNF